MNTPNRSYLLPESLDISPEKQAAFFDAIKQTRIYLLALLHENNPFYSPELLPSPNLCGYTAPALVEHFIERERKARVVYGLYFGNGINQYHYWAEVEDATSQEKYVVQPTDGLFLIEGVNEIRCIPIEELEDYKLREWKIGDEVLLPTDAGSIHALNENNGLLPLKQDLSEDRYRLYEAMVNSLR